MPVQQYEVTCAKYEDKAGNVFNRGDKLESDLDLVRVFPNAFKLVTVPKQIKRVQLNDPRKSIHDSAMGVVMAKTMQKAPSLAPEDEDTDHEEESDEGDAEKGTEDGDAEQEASQDVSKKFQKSLKLHPEYSVVKVENGFNVVNKTSGIRKNNVDLPDAAAVKAYLKKMK